MGWVAQGVLPSTLGQTNSLLPDFQRQTLEKYNGDGRSFFKQSKGQRNSPKVSASSDEEISNLT